MRHSTCPFHTMILQRTNMINDVIRRTVMGSGLGPRNEVKTEGQEAELAVEASLRVRRGSG